MVSSISGSATEKVVVQIKQPAKPQKEVENTTSLKRQDLKPPTRKLDVKLPDLDKEVKEESTQKAKAPEVPQSEVAIKSSSANSSGSVNVEA